MHSTYCPGCGLLVKSGSSTKEHSRLWHKSCYSLFAVGGELLALIPYELETDEDIQDLDARVKETTKKTRRILTGNGTFLFYDDAIKDIPGSVGRKDSLPLSKLKSSASSDSIQTDPIPSSVDIHIPIEL